MLQKFAKTFANF